MAVAARLLERVGKIVGSFSGKRVLVLGGGVIGMSSAMLLRYMKGCENVDLYDISSWRTAVAEKAGMRIPAANELEVQGDGNDYASMYAAAKYDVVLETTGVASVFANALNLVKPGGVLGCVGMISKAEIVQKLIVTKALTVLGSIGGTGNFGEAMEFLSQHPELADLLVSHHFPIASFAEAFDTACNPKESMKVVLDL